MLSEAAGARRERWSRSAAVADGVSARTWATIFGTAGTQKGPHLESGKVAASGFPHCKPGYQEEIFKAHGGAAMVWDLILECSPTEPGHRFEATCHQKDA